MHPESEKETLQGLKPIDFSCAFAATQRVLRVVPRHTSPEVFPLQ